MGKVVRKYWVGFLFSMLLKVVGEVIFIGSNYFSYIIFNKAISENAKLTDIWLQIVFAFVATLGSLTITYLSNILNSYVGYKMKMRFKDVVSYKINSMTDEEIEKYKKGELLSWYENDAPAIYLALDAKLIKIWHNITMCIVSISLLFIFVHWIVGVTAIIGGILIIFVPVFFGGITSKKQQELMIKNGELTQGIENLVNGYSEFAFRNKKSLFVKLTQGFSNKVENTKIKIEGLNFITSLLIGIFQVILQQGVFVGAGILYYLGYVEPGAMLVSISFSAYFMQGFGGLINNIETAIKGKKIIKKFSPVVFDKDFEGKDIFFEELAIKGLNYSVENKQIFKDFNSIINANKKYLVVGESGKGKTTLFRIIFGIIKNYSGDLEINKNINYKNLAPEDLKHLYSYLPQEPSVFNDTLRNNISLWDESISDEKIIDALKKVNLSKVLEENGLDGVINFESKNLSGGELQRVAIARAIVEDKQVMIMDEITASLDKENRESIENLIGSLNKTILYISHTTDADNKNFDQVIKL
ncbi:ATP-binding cassette domain-containing protein [Spiroplasma tabanidicola]|uniref:ABC transporter ATP-binding protein n=1 Tax=Spiroplasma tabanidicola TaxID=324079 RepID=A0A6I6CDJ3_9MOLU|nr:ABC transporter ATP-binding protein [Spiroplasma tabanidicola]QGS52378.1 ABC transporter ATP-binding protein [Spiroplasma tabanidicola]